MDTSSILIGYSKLTSEKSSGSVEENSDSAISRITLDLKRANRHGLIAGATGTGKTVTLQALAESFSGQGVPVFLVDVKGDVSGISQAGKTHPKINERFDILGLPGDAWKGCPTVFWDLYGKQGHPIRATISDMGPLLLARLLGLNATQQGMLDIAFAVADDQGLLLLDLKDFRSILQYIADHAAELRNVYGNVSSTSIGAIQRRLLGLERSGAKSFFGEPMLELSDLMKLDESGSGYINVLSANKLVQEPTVYSTLLLWLLSELFEELPEIGDPEKPKLVLFFDEATSALDAKNERIIMENLNSFFKDKTVIMYWVGLRVEKIIELSNNSVPEAAVKAPPALEAVIEPVAKALNCPLLEVLPCQIENSTPSAIVCAI